MSSKVRLLALVLCLSVVVIFGSRRIGLFLSSAVNQNSTSPLVYETDIPETWYEGSSGYEEALRVHRRTPAAMIVYFQTDWCPYCKRLDRDILPSAEVTAFLKTVIKVRVNPENSPKERALADNFGVHGYPSVFIVRADSDVPVKVYPFIRTGETFQPLPPAEFVETCRRAAGL